MSVKQFLVTQFNRDSKVPKYLQIREAVRRLIESGKVQENEHVPSERDLTDWFGVSRMTVRQAMDELVREGLLERKLGDGTFVKGLKISGRMLGFGSFSEELALSGKKTSTILLGQVVMRAPAEIGQKLEILEEETSVIRIERIRHVEGLPISHQISYLPFNLCNEVLTTDLNVHSLYQHLTETLGLKVRIGRERIQAVLANKEGARQLQVPPDQPCFLISRLLYAENEQRPVEYVETLIRGDKFMFVNQIDGKGNE